MFRRLRPVVVTLAVAALIALVLEYGFNTPPVPRAVLVSVEALAVVIYLVYRACELSAALSKWRALRRMWLDSLLLLGGVGFLVFGVEFAEVPALKTSGPYISAVQGMIGLRLFVEAIRLKLALAQSGMPPARIMVATFGVLIIAGAIALALPRAIEPHVCEADGFSVGRHILNCAFTSVSATCVTGLTVYDTGSDFTRFGQLVILGLMQLGGLGIMIFGGVFGILVHRRLSMREALALQDTMSLQAMGQIRRMVLFIVVFTFLAEAVGAIAFYPMWSEVESGCPRAFCSVFHAVSAFCNAGFSLQSDSMVAYSGCWQVYMCMMPLIVVGGLGFPVLHDLWCWSAARIRRRFFRQARSGPNDPIIPRARLTLHTRMALAVTALLIVLPVVGFVVFESAPVRVDPVAAAGEQITDRAMRSSSFPGQVLDGLFLSVTCRTAGFNTVKMDTDSMSTASHFLTCILMFIGGSPASTAGGIKTVALAVLLLGLWATIRGRSKVEVWGRTIPEATVRRAAVIVVAMFGFVSLVTLALAFAEPITLREALFESVSACGTVGLSTGVTPGLTVAGRVVIIVAMFAGRLGPLTLMLALAGKAKPSAYDYPEEQVGIG